MNYLITALIVSIVIIFTINDDTGTTIGGGGGQGPHPKISNNINVVK